MSSIKTGQQIENSTIPRMNSATPPRAEQLVRSRATGIDCRRIESINRAVQNGVYWILGSGSNLLQVASDLSRSSDPVAEVVGPRTAQAIKALPAQTLEDLGFKLKPEDADLAVYWKALWAAYAMVLGAPHCSSTDAEKLFAA